MAYLLIVLILLALWPVTVLGERLLEGVRAARAGRELEAGRPAGFRVTLHGQAGKAGTTGQGAEPPPAPTRGELWLEPGSGRGYFTGRGTGTVVIRCGGSALELGTWTSRPGAALRRVGLFYEPRSGGELFLDVPAPVGPVLVRTLARREVAWSLDAAPRRLPSAVQLRAPRWAAYLLLLSVLLGLFFVHTFTLGRETQARVTALLPEDSCAVSWQDPWEPERTRQGRIGCHSGTEAGDLLGISARPWPFRGRAADLADSPEAVQGLLIMTGVPGLAGVAVAGVLASRRQRAVLDLLDHDTGPEPLAPAARPSAPARGGGRKAPPDRLRFDQMSDLAVDLDDELPGAGLPRTEPDLRTAPWWRSPALRLLALRRAVAWQALGMLVGCLLASVGVWVTAARLYAGETAQTTARVERIAAMNPLEAPPGLSARVSFRAADGRQYQVWVPYFGGGSADGSRPTVEYAVGDPSAARIVGDPAYAVLLWGGTAGTVVLGAWITVRARRGLHEVRARHRAAASPQGPEMPYVLLPFSALAPDFGPLLVLYRRGAAGELPWAVLPVRAGPDRRPALAGVPAAGTLTLPEEEERDGPGHDAVPWLDGRPLWPAGELRELDRDGLGELRADLADWYEDDEDDEDGEDVQDEAVAPGR